MWEHDAVLWAKLATTKRCNNAFLTYRRRHKCLDKFFSKITKDVERRGKETRHQLRSSEIQHELKGRYLGPAEVPGQEMPAARCHSYDKRVQDIAASAATASGS